MGWMVLFAAPRRDPFREPEVIWGTAGIAVALLVGALVIWMVDRWRKKAAAGDDLTLSSLTDFRGMYERGEITEEEYNRLRDRVAQQVKEKDAKPKGTAETDTASGASGGTSPSPPASPPPPSGSDGETEPPQ